MKIDCSIALDILSMANLFILLFGLRGRERSDRAGRAYFQIILLVLAFLSLDVAYLALYGRPWARAAIAAVKSAYFVVNAAIVWTWARFVLHTLFPGAAGGHSALYTALFAADAAIVLVNCVCGWMFSISEEGTIVIGYVAMWVFTLFNYLSTAAVMLLLYRNRNWVKRETLLPFLLFPVLPLCAELVQIAVRSVSLICTYALSTLMLYQVSQGSLIYTDALTGLGNRRLLDEYLGRWFDGAGSGKVCGVMIDLDGLKDINDTRGHLCGDQMLVRMAEVIRRSERKGMVATRYGGDEFVVVWRDGEERIGDLLRRLEQARTALNGQSSGEGGQLSFSTGSLCCERGGLDVADFLRRLDGEMYRVKNAKKQGVSPSAADPPCPQ
ncbi:GGDEF domain-containing protein [Acetanaerobacterium sp. MSJ-12]|uniref:GGDEF domain-containing protein n=1 Tax=Acetanaerobacterium sp. MSJ-12 TaxID=2841535 RepID=UPI001C0F130A|nr:GGDEF domain-containing protein [Acetanaerobacterium sp. MSJ-12]